MGIGPYLQQVNTCYPFQWCMPCLHQCLSIKHYRWGIIVLEHVPRCTVELQWLEFFLGTQERVRNSRGKRAISVRATEVLGRRPMLYYKFPRNTERRKLME